MSISVKPKVLIQIEIKFDCDADQSEEFKQYESYYDDTNLPSCNPINLLHEYWANISVETGGYIHNRDTIKTERRKSRRILFATKLCVEYLFEEKQMIIVEIFNSENPDVAIGQIDCSIGRVIHSGGSFQKTLECIRSDKSAASNKELTSTDVTEETKSKINEEMSLILPDVTIYVEEDLTSKENLELKIRGFGLAKTEIFGKTDPYLAIFRSNNRGRYIQCYRTDVLRNTQNPDWKPLTVSYERLCNNNFDSKLCIRVYCGDGTLAETEEVDLICDQMIGEVKLTPRELINTSINEERKFELINPKKKKKKKSYVNSGLIFVKSQRCKSEPTFLDFMFKGLELNFIVAIDLTLSNGDSNSPQSLHFIESMANNEYAIAIQAVLEILQEYDNDELFPAFGFGARVPPDYKICHEYPLNGNFEYPYCYGAEGVIRAYQETLKIVKLAGPTCFAPVIRYVSRIAKNSESGKHYFVLLILTDGTVDDWMETKKAVIETSYLPVSIIVVGVGGGKFSDMEILDQDFGLLAVTSEKACRDNVQFVKMRRYLRLAADGSDNVRWGKVALAKDVLAELPYQVLEYMNRRVQLESYLEGLLQNNRGVTSSVFSSCLLRHSSSSDSNETFVSSRPFAGSFKRSYNNNNNSSGSGNNSANPVRNISAQSRSRLLKNNRQYSVDSAGVQNLSGISSFTSPPSSQHASPSLYSKQAYSRKTPPFQRKSNIH